MINFDFTKTEERKYKLNKMYDKFYCDKGKCQHYDTCSKEMCTKYSYSSSRCIKLGKYYDIKANGNDIRIVFVGKEGPNKQEAIGRPAKLSESLVKGRVTTHWLTSYKMICDMLNAEKYKSVRGPFRNQPDMCLQAFALTNVYRCAFKNKGLDQRTDIPNNEQQKNNCISILKEELSILNPTILVLQGIKVIDLFDDSEQIKNGLFLRKTNSNFCYIIETHHPCWREKGKNWEKTEHPIFIENVEYLRSKGILPPKHYDVCKYLNDNYNYD